MLGSNRPQSLSISRDVLPNLFLADAFGRCTSTWRCGSAALN